MTDLSQLAAAFWRVMPADPDPVETREWLDAFNSLIESGGRERGEVGGRVAFQARSPTTTNRSNHGPATRVDTHDRIDLRCRLVPLRDLGGPLTLRPRVDSGRPAEVAHEV